MHTTNTGLLLPRDSTKYHSPSTKISPLGSACLVQRFLLQNEEAPAVHSPHLFPPVLSHYCAYVLEGLTKHLQILVIRRPLCLPFLYSFPSFHTLTNCSNRGSLALDLNQCVRMHCPQYIPVSRGSLGHRLLLSQ